jgi:hypothetical protein
MIWNKEETTERLEKQEEGIFEISKKREKTIRSKAQNKFYFWIVIKIIWDFHGYSPVETHNLIKGTFKLKTTTDLSKSEFKYMIEIIQDLWKTKYNCIIPNPSDLTDDISLYKSLGF